MPRDKTACVFCEKKHKVGLSFCPACRQPTSYASHEERTQYELAQYTNGKSKARAVHAPPPPPPRRRQRADTAIDVTDPHPAGGVSGVSAPRVSREAARADALLKKLESGPPPERPRVGTAPRAPASEPTTTSAVDGTSDADPPAKRTAKRSAPKKATTKKAAPKRKAAAKAATSKTHTATPKTPRAPGAKGTTAVPAAKGRSVATKDSTAAKKKPAATRPTTASVLTKQAELLGAMTERLASMEERLQAIDDALRNGSGTKKRAFRRKRRSSD